MNKCIVCKAELEIDVVTIGEQLPSAVFPDSDSLDLEEIEISSLNLARCTDNACNLVQLTTDYDLDVVFRNYPYTTGTTATMTKILGSVVEEALAVVNLTSDDVVLDIGGNDGTLLSLINLEVKHKINIDAAHGIDSVQVVGRYTKLETLFCKNAYESVSDKPPKIVFSVAMFYHLSNPVGFCTDVAAIMDSETVWVVQMTYLGSMLKENIYDNILHEHKAYYSLYSLENLLERCGLYVCGARVVESYGGSIRVYIKKNRTKIHIANLFNEYLKIKKSEKELQVNERAELILFNERIQRLKRFTVELVSHIVAAEGKICAIGASTKGNMICQFVGIDHSLIEYVVDNNPKKVGKMMIGSNIPIFAESEWIDNLKDFILILPYYYVDFFAELVKQNVPRGEKKYLIVPLPFPRIIEINGMK